MCDAICFIVIGILFCSCLSLIQFTICSIEESSTEANLLDNDENRLKPVWEGTKGNADAK